MLGRRGYTGEGGDSIMSWPRDKSSSYLAFQNAVIEELEAKVEKIIRKMLHNKTR
jgi:hypothetical protein